MLLAKVLFNQHVASPYKQQCLSMAIVVTCGHRVHVRGESMLRSPPPGQVCTSSQAATLLHFGKHNAQGLVSMQRRGPLSLV